jgi:CRISPR/Cas system-associated exonuclease Cas4 (RecB family)
VKVNASLLKKWMSCPLQVKFSEIEKRPEQQNAKASFGTIVHDALEFYNICGDLEETKKRFLIHWANPDMLGVAPDVWPKGSSFGGLRKTGLEVLERYHEKNKWEKRTILATEFRFCVPIGEHELSGIVDLIEVKKNSKGKDCIRLIDFKSHSKKPNLFTLKMDIQFTSYVLASLQPEFWMGHDSDRDKYAGFENGEELYYQYRNTERHPIWYHLLDNKEIAAGHRDDNDFMRLYRLITEIEKAVNNDVYVPSISADSCTWCPYTDICKVMIPVRDKLGVVPEPF